MSWLKYLKSNETVSSSTVNSNYSYPYCKRVIQAFTPRDDLEVGFWLFCNIKDLNINIYKSSTIQNVEDQTSYIVTYEILDEIIPVKTVINGDYIYFQVAEKHNAAVEVPGSYCIYYSTPNIRKLNPVDNGGIDDYQISLSGLSNPYYGSYSEVDQSDYLVDLSSDSSYNFSFINSTKDWEQGLSSKPGAKLYINFSGPKFSLNGSKGADYGKFKIKFTALETSKSQSYTALDWQIIDCFSSSSLEAIELFSKEDFEERDYVAELEVMYEKNILSRGNNIKVDSYSFSYNVYLEVGDELLNQVDNVFVKIAGVR